MEYTDVKTRLKSVLRKNCRANGLNKKETQKYLKAMYFKINKCAKALFEEQGK